LSVVSCQLGARDGDGDGDAGRDEAWRGRGGDEVGRGGDEVGRGGDEVGRGGRGRAGQSTAEGAGAVPD
jgi:hypothetical protein